jgi:hypothetical protein
LLEVSFPMELPLRYWIRNGNAVCLDRGPLTYSLKIGEKSLREGGAEEWPGCESGFAHRRSLISAVAPPREGTRFRPFGDSCPAEWVCFLTLPPVFEKLS